MVDELKGRSKPSVLNSDLITRKRDSIEKAHLEQTVLGPPAGHAGLHAVPATQRVAHSSH